MRTPHVPPLGAAAAPPDFTTPEGLRQVLTELTEQGTWSTSPIAAELMIYAERKYTAVAKAWHRESADAAYEAFIAMRSRSTVRADDPWAVVTRAVELGVAAETHAERLLTSSDKARRPSKRPAFEPVRAGHYEEFFYDIHPLLHPGSTLIVVDASDDTPVGGGVDEVIRTASVFLITTGWPARRVEQAIEYICQRMTTLGSHDSALDVLGKDSAIAMRLGYSLDTWAALLRLVIGTKQGRKNPGRIGIFARTLLGDRVPDLLQDTELVTAAKQSLFVNASGVRGVR